MKILFKKILFTKIKSMKQQKRRKTVCKMIHFQCEKMEALYNF